MINNAFENIHRIVVIGDAYVSPITLYEAASKLPIDDLKIDKFMWGTGDKDEFSMMQTEIEKDGPDAVAYPEGLDEAIVDADMLLFHFCPIPKKLLEKANKLKLVGICRGGYENIDAQTLTERNIPLIHIIRNAEAVAEFTLGLMLAETRNIARSHSLITKGEWPTVFPNSEFSSTLRNLTVGIVGLGNIGALLAQKLNALGVKVYGYDGYIKKEVLETMPIEVCSSMEEIFSKSDVVSLHLRLSEENRGFINKSLLEKMKPTSYLINASRAGLINNDDLVDVLTNHKIAGCALDVFEQEPIEKDDPLIKLDNVTLTPHIAGDTVDAIAKSPFQLVDAILDYVTKNDTRNVCNKVK